MAMDRDGRQLLAGSRFAEHEHRCVRAREAPHRIEQPQHRAAGADDAFLFGFEPFAVAREQAFHAVRMADRIGDPLVRRRQRDVIEAIVAQQRAHVRRSRLADVDECDPDDVAHRRAGRRNAADRVGVAAAQVEDAAGDLAGCIAQLTRLRDDRHFPVASRQFLSQHDGRRLRPVNQRTLPVTTPRAGALIARYWHIHNEPSLSPLREPFACAAAGGAWPPFRAAFPQLWRRSKLHTARTPGGRAGCHPASLSSNSKGTRGCGSHDVPALKRPAVKAERVGRRECRRHVRHVVHDYGARCRTGWPPTRSRNDCRISSASEFTPRFEMVVLPKDNPESTGYATCRTAPHVFVH